MPTPFRCLPALLLALCLCIASHAANALPTFKHIIIVIQENRTPDNIFGSNPTFEPGVDIGTTGVTSTGQTVPLTPVELASCYDLSHTHQSFVLSLTKGADRDPPVISGTCTAPANPQFKYVDNTAGKVQPYFDIATNYGFANRMFQTNQGPSFPAHQFLFGGTSSPSTESPVFVAENNLYQTQSVGCAAPATQRMATILNGVETSPGVYPCFTRPTMADLLDNAGLSWTYYAAMANGLWLAPNSISTICQPQIVAGNQVCGGTEWKSHIVGNNSARILTDIASCKLSAVSWVTPTGQNSDHAGELVADGPSWVASIVDAVGSQPGCGPSNEVYWQDTAIFITWDDWGGWFDHVKPFTTVAPSHWGYGYAYGFRVPLLVVSAFTQAQTVSNTDYDFGSLLYFVERNFGLGKIGPGDTVYSKYADFHAVSRGPLNDFFNLARPKPFVPIVAPVTAHDFITSTVPPDPPDND